MTFLDRLARRFAQAPGTEAPSDINIADYIDSMICVTDLNYKLVYINNSYAAAHGIDPDNYEGKLCYELKNTDKPCDFCALAHHLSLDKPFVPHDFGITFEPSLDRWIDGRAAIVKWPDGRWVQLYYMFDATEQHQELTRSQNQAEELRKEAEEAHAESAAKSAFIAGTSHEIFTPMNNIIGFLELALDDKIPEHTREHLTKVAQNTKWLLSIINDIIDISKIEAGTFELERVPFEVNDVLSHCQALLAPNAISKNIVMHLYAEPFPGKRLVGDPAKLGQICTNLLSNAIKFTDYGAIKLSAILQDVKDDVCLLRVEVTDSGAGMTPEQIEGLLESYANSNDGLGLGLPITKRLIEAMGGQLAVKSAPGLGSKFSFTLAFPIVDIDPSSAVDILTDRSPVKKPVFKTSEVLVVEDNEMNQSIVCEHLKRVGLYPVVVGNGKEAVDAVRRRLNGNNEMFGLIFMDIHMPRMDGLEASSIISELHTDVPIIAMTANTMPVSQEIYTRYGIDDVINKPYTTQDLWKMLLKYLPPIETPGISTEGLQENNSEFYMKVRRFFVANNQNTFDKIHSAIEDEDYELAHRMVHDLKSNAGHIGKTGLQLVAQSLELELKERRFSPVLLDGLRSVLEATLQDLSHLKENDDPPKQRKAVSHKEFLKITDGLDTLLDSGNIDYLQYVDKLKAVPGSEKVIDNLLNFDAPGAADALSILSENLERWG